MVKRELISYQLRGIILIDWIRAEYADKLKIYFKNGDCILASGNGLEIGEDIDEDDDIFFVCHEGKPVMLPISTIEKIDILREFKEQNHN